MLELAAAVYLTLMTWLLTGWMMDDSVAFGMTAGHWYFVGAKRLLVALALAAAFGVLCYFANRRWVAPALPSHPEVAKRAALGLGLCSALAGIAAAVQFVISRPFM